MLSFCFCAGATKLQNCTTLYIEQSKEKLGVETLPTINTMNTVQLSVLPFKPFKSKESELLWSGQVSRFLTCEVQTFNALSCQSSFFDIS